MVQPVSPSDTGDITANTLHEAYVPRYSRRSVFTVALSFMALASVNALVTLLPFLGAYEPKRGVVALVCVFFGAASLLYLRKDRIDRAVYAICAGMLAAITLFQVTVGAGVRAPLNAAVAILIPFAGLILGHAAARNALLVALTWLSGIVGAEMLGFIPGMHGTNIPVLMPSYAFYCGLCICIYALTDNYSSVVARAVNDLVSEQGARNSAEIGKAQAEAVLRYKDEFLAMLSHEIRTPLAGVKSGVQLLSHPNATDAMKQRAFTAIRQAVDNTSEVLNNLLDNSKIDAGKLVLNTAPVALPELLEKISNLYQVQAEARGLDFAVTVEGVPEQPFDLDAPRLTQMMSNLLGNAIKFTTKGGVQLRVQWLTDAPSSIRVPPEAPKFVT